MMYTISKKNKVDGKIELPKYRRLALYLANDIKNGVYKIGALIPSLGENSREQGVSIPTVSSAYDLLRKHGVITLNVGVRYVVKSKNIDKFLAEEIEAYQ